MKYLWAAFLALFISTSVYARDNYPIIEWGSQFFATPNVDVKSAYKLNKRQKRIVKNVYNLTEKKFFEFWNINKSECRLDPLSVIIVRSHQELDDREKFPNEDVYADRPWEGTEVIFGRYYSYTNRLYIVPVDTSRYYWRANFSHEIIHYLFDECHIKFRNLDEEHKMIDLFLDEYKILFY